MRKYMATLSSCKGRAFSIQRQFWRLKLLVKPCTAGFVIHQGITFHMRDIIITGIKDLAKFQFPLRCKNAQEKTIVIFA